MAAPLLLVGAGRMGGALLQGWLARGLGPVVVVETDPSPVLKRIAKRDGGARFLRTLDRVPSKLRACVIALKPQVLNTEVVKLKAVAQSGVPMISIAAGSSIGMMAKAWGKSAHIVRAMPNTPGSIGEGISALYAPRNATRADRKLAELLLAALGKTVWVKRETDIDTVTAVSGSGPAYVFLLVECLAAAGREEGLPADVALTLARQMVIGAGALLKADSSPAEELRRNVTSPHGTTEAALKVLMARDGLALLIKKAVSAARKRAGELAA